jgi:CBS domain-containing protein
MITVRDILQSKGSDVYSVTPDTTVYEALQVMAEKNVGAVLVMDGDRLVGLFSERDYARKVELKGLHCRETPVTDIMTSRILVVRPDETTEDCMALMTDKRVRHLPAVEGDQVIGIVSIGDVVKSIISEKEFIIEQLENYITGSAYRP